MFENITNFISQPNFKEGDNIILHSRRFNRREATIIKLNEDKKTAFVLTADGEEYKVDSNEIREEQTIPDIPDIITQSVEQDGEYRPVGNGTGKEREAFNVASRAMKSIQKKLGKLKVPIVGVRYESTNVDKWNNGINCLWLGSVAFAVEFLDINGVKHSATVRVPIVNGLVQEPKYMADNMNRKYAMDSDGLKNFLEGIDWMTDENDIKGNDEAVWNIPGQNPGYATFDNISFIKKQSYVDPKMIDLLMKGEKSAGLDKKVFKENPPIGSSKYSISFHDGEKTHEDGSPFFDIKIFKNKIDLQNGIKDLESQGYVEESFSEFKEPRESSINKKAGNEEEIIEYIKDNYPDEELNDEQFLSLLQAIFTNNSYEELVSIFDKHKFNQGKSASLDKKAEDYSSLSSEQLRNIAEEKFGRGVLKDKLNQMSDEEIINELIERDKYMLEQHPRLKERQEKTEEDIKKNIGKFNITLIKSAEDNDIATDDELRLLREEILTTQSGYETKDGVIEIVKEQPDTNVTDYTVKKNDEDVLKTTQETEVIRYLVDYLQGSGVQANLNKPLDKIALYKKFSQSPWSKIKRIIKDEDDQEKMRELISLREIIDGEISRQQAENENNGLDKNKNVDLKRKRMLDNMYLEVLDKYRGGIDSYFNSEEKNATIDRVLRNIKAKNKKHATGGAEEEMDMEKEEEEKHRFKSKKTQQKPVEKQEGGSISGVDSAVPSGTGNREFNDMSAKDPTETKFVH